MENKQDHQETITTNTNQMEENNLENKAAGKKKKFKIIGGIAALVIALVVYVWISGIGHQKTDNAQVDAVIMPIRATVQGFVTKVNFSDNQMVKKGDVLIEIDGKDYVTRLKQAQAVLESAKAQLEIAKSGASTADMNAMASSLNSQAAKDNIASARAKFSKNEKEMNRMDKMLKDGAVSQQQFESVKAEFETSKAQWDMLEKHYQASSSQASGLQSQADGQKSQIVLAEAIVKQREAELALAQTQLDNTFLKAPFDGIISKKSIDVGQYLQIGTPVCSAVDYNNLWVSANFKETQINEMRPNQPVDIKIDAFPKAHIQGKLQSFGGATGARFSLLPPDNATGNFVKITQRVPVKILITEYPRELLGLLLPGLSAEVDIHTK
ncbi:secretion protein HlyD [Sphingobacteriaceae bacterium]|nr:secretion protein HlyD [Sphingobacteriaceae bacterium]